MGFGVSSWLQLGLKFRISQPLLLILNLPIVSFAGITELQYQIQTKQTPLRFYKSGLSHQAAEVLRLPAC